jgi:transposase
MKYGERNEAVRSAFLQEIAEIPEDSLIYVDESGIDKEMNREYGRAPRGERVYGEVRGRKFDRTKVIAGKCGGKVIAPGEYKGTTDHRLFEAWFSGALLREAKPGSVIVLDNATFHRKKTLRKLAEQAGCSVLFLPPYSPDLNPIEKLWANLKIFFNHHLRFFNSLSAAICAFFLLV